MYKDEDILAMQRVTPAIAAQYLGLSVEKVRDGLYLGVFPFGVAIRTEGGERICYDIRPAALVKYNREGWLDIDSLAEKVCDRLARRFAK